VAAELARAFIADTDRVEAWRTMRDDFEGRLVARLDGAAVNGGDAPRLWNTSNLGFPNLEAEAVLIALSERGVCASAGAACSSGSLEPSPVLLAVGVDERVPHGSIRLSLSRETTTEEIDGAIEAVARVVAQLSRAMPG